MKIAFVAGFCDPVKQKFDEHYSAQQANGSLVWVRQKDLHREADLTLLSARILEPIRGASDVRVRVALFVPPGREWVVPSVEGILRKAQELNPALQFDEIARFGDDSDCDGVLGCIQDFDLPVASGICLATVRKKIPEGTIVCIWHEDKTSILKALERAGFTEDTKQLFAEKPIKGGKNSNLPQDIASWSLHHRYMIYAFEGLRHLSPSILKKFVKYWYRGNAAQAVEQFKKWITEDD